MTALSRVAWLSAIAALLMTAPPDAAAECLPFLARPSSTHIVPGASAAVFATPPGGPALTLDAYAQQDRQVHPAVVVVHGGGWTSGGRQAHIGQLLETITEAGYQWVAVDYRLGGPSRWRDAVADVRDALAFVRCHAAALAIDPGRIVLLGEDAGAQLVAQAAVEERVSGIALVGGVYTQPMGEPRAPALVIHGGADGEAPVAEARAFCDAAAARQLPCRLDVVAGASHRVENWWPSQWGYKARLTEWLKERLGPGAARPDVFTPQPARAAFTPGLHKRVIYNTETEQTLDAFVPPGPGPHVPVLLVHGGGWEAGDRVTYVTPLFQPLADAGVAWFSIDYRLLPDVTHTQQEQDLRDAIAFLRERAGSFNIDPRRLVLVGESASGEMVAAIGTEDRALAGVVSFYGVYDFVPMADNLTPRSVVTRLFGITALNAASREQLDAHSPIRRVHRDQPPFLLIHGTGERLWEQGTAMAARLAAVGARHELVALEKAPHGLENWEGHPEWTTYKATLVEWIRRVTR